MTRTLIAVDGPDGSGKSRFAARLAAACGGAGAPAALVHVDDFRRPVDFDAADDEAVAYYDRYYDFPALEACLRAFLGGAGQVAIPRFDPARGVLDGQLQVSFDDAALCVVEGVFVLRAPAACAAPVILLEVGADEARRRILARDGARGRAPAEIERRLARRYLPSQRRYRAELDPVARADVIVDNDRWDDPRLLRREMGRFPPAAAQALARLFLP